MPGAKRYAFTLFRDTPPVFDSKYMKYLCYGRELCPDTQRVHYQAFVSFWKQTRISAIKKISDLKTAHFEVARGTVEENIAYCSKDGDFCCHGIIPEEQSDAGAQKNKADWEGYRELAKKGKFDDIPAVVSIRFFNNLQKIWLYDRNIRVPATLAPGSVSGLWLHGPPGVGKSHWARTYFADGGVYDKSLNKWWDNYVDQDTVILDDLDPFHKCLGNLLKRWADLYVFPAEIKGAVLQLRPAVVVVTSNYSIADIWPEDILLQEALQRRFVVHYCCDRAFFDDLTFVKPSRNAVLPSQSDSPA